MPNRIYPKSTPCKNLIVNVMLKFLLQKKPQNMQSKLPIRIKRKKCFCSQLFKIMVDNPAVLDNATQCTFRDSSTQTDEIFLDQDKKPYSEIKSLLVSINYILEHILLTLQNKKEILYHKLQEEVTQSNKKINNNKNTGKIKKKNMQINKNYSYIWPEISRLYYDQPNYCCWPKHYMQNINSNFMICAKRPSWIQHTTRPFSCPDINCPVLTCKPYAFSSNPNKTIRLVGQGDLNFGDNDDENIDDSIEAVDNEMELQ